MNLKEAIKEARNTERKFKQTFDIIINLKNIDLKRPENRIKTDVNLPKGLGKPSKIGLIVDALASETVGLENVIVIKRDELIKLDKKKIKKLCSEVKMFLAEAPLMPLVGKHMGQVLAPKGMMPKPIPTTLKDLKGPIAKFTNDVKINVTKSPTAQAPLGTVDMSDEDIEINAKAVINAVSAALPRGKEQIKSLLIKTTMGKPVRVSKW
ncbi:MAG: 50S ribosomal protein L1 [Nanoarchaeota archaeon]|nr:50S ribosomal protein L1 [Nanoarchaeota archaeon]